MSDASRPVGTLVYALLLAAMALGLLLVGLGLWRLGLALAGIAFVLAAVARLLIGENAAGLLRVRRRWFDVAWMGVIGIALVTLAAIVPAAFS